MIYYTNNEEGEYSVYSSLSLWPSSTRAEIVAIFLALLIAPENSNVTIYKIAGETRGEFCYQFNLPKYCYTNFFFFNGLDDLNLNQKIFGL
ncbi:unnamed protein product [Rhizophagus irregularis]|nr:unnamed protein product [Rhizophagus irregularis]